MTKSYMHIVVFLLLNMMMIVDMMNSLFHKNKRRIVNMGIAVYKVTMGNNCTVGLIQIMAANRLSTCANKMTMTYKNIKKNKH